MTMVALYIREDTEQRLRKVVVAKVRSIRETNAIPEYQGVTSDHILNWLIDTTRKYYKLGDA